MTIRCCLSFVLLTTLVGPLSAVDLKQIDRSIAREPAYKTKAPKYCLLVFGPEAKTRVWLVLDGDTLYVDRNGNGDLTEKDEMVALPAFTKARFDATFYTGTRDIQAGLVTAFPKGWQELTLAQRQFDPMRIPETPQEAELLNHPDRPRDNVLTIIRLPQAGAGADATGFLQFATRPEDAPIIHFGGPLHMVLHPMRKAKFKQGRESDLRLAVGTPGLGKGTFTFLPHEEVPKDVHPVAEIEFPQQEAGKPPIKLRVTLNKRCCGDCFHGPVLVPEAAALGQAEVSLSFSDWKDGRVTAGTSQIPVVEGDDAVSSDDLYQIGIAYHNFLKLNPNKVPQSLEDLEPDLKDAVIGHLKSKRIVFHYGVAPKDMPAGSPILAHERDAATNGGLVLFWDGSVMNLTAKGFNKFPIAKVKK